MFLQNIPSAVQLFKYFLGAFLKAYRSTQLLANQLKIITVLVQGKVRHMFLTKSFYLIIIHRKRFFLSHLRSFQASPQTS